MTVEPTEVTEAPRKTNGSPLDVSDDPNLKDHESVSRAEREALFARPVRRLYIHDTCGEASKMSIEVAEAWARKPGTMRQFKDAFCGYEEAWAPLGEFAFSDGERLDGKAKKTKAGR